MYTSVSKRHRGRSGTARAAVEYKDAFFHECHDCLQALLYPCRYLQSWRKLKSEPAEYLDSTEIGLVIIGKQCQRLRATRQKSAINPS